MQTESEWTAAIGAHRASLDGFIRAADAIGDDGWDRPLATGKWSPGQVAEHLRMVYQIIGRELEGGPGIRLRTSWWIRPFLRVRFLPGILRRGKIPVGAPAPREARPGPGPHPKAPLLASLRETAASAEATLTSRRGSGAVATHHIFGPLDPDQLIRFLAVHNDHHTRQLEPR